MISAHADISEKHPVRRAEAERRALAPLVPRWSRPPPPRPPTAAHRSARPLPVDPFTLGVASGDPEPDGFVIWTRLAPSPLDDDGLGGMPSHRYPVQWQVAEDERFRRIRRVGVVLAGPESAHAVHVEVHGLRPGREYYYRFRVQRWTSPVGRGVTARRTARPWPRSRWRSRRAPTSRPASSRRTGTSPRSART